TINVAADNPPVASNDLYTVIGNSSLAVSAPGVLANDSDVDGNSIAALLVSGPTNGLLIFTNTGGFTNGGFTYLPNPGFIGLDAFTYRASDGLSNSAPATVFI